MSTFEFLCARGRSDVINLYSDEHDHFQHPLARDGVLARDPIRNPIDVFARLYVMVSHRRTRRLREFCGSPIYTAFVDGLSEGHFDIAEHPLSDHELRYRGETVQRLRSWGEAYKRKAGFYLRPNALTDLMPGLLKEPVNLHVK